ncbi:MAG: SDR family NAD(P)-dependent oxidoreductase [Cyanobacteria bacterium P01_A01_bin.83]
MTQIAQQTILLTGASGGIGRPLTRMLTQKGATVIGVSRSGEKLKQLSAEIEAEGGHFIPLVWDLSRLEQLHPLIQECDRLAGGVDILINNAGIQIYRPFAHYSLAELQNILALNLQAAMELTRLLLPEMLGRNRGHIVNLASLAGKTGHPYDSVYAASKAGLLMWSDAVRQELADTEVKMTTVCPGYVTSAGLLTATGIPAPRLAGVSQPEVVAQVVVKAIACNQAETVINGNPIMTIMTKLLLASEQLFPSLKNLVNRWLGVTQLNQKRSSVWAKS